MSSERAALLRQRLESLEPDTIELIDESHLHAGHEGARDGASHFRLIISSPHFAGLSPLARHRLVYDSVADLIPYPIHALAIVTRVTTS